MEPSSDQVVLDVFSDVACPWCFVGLRMLQQAREGWDGPSVDLQWRAFQLAPENPPEGIPFARVIDEKFGGAQQYAAATDRLREIGREVGIPFALERIAVSPNTRLAHAVIAQARQAGNPDAVVEALFTGYFCEGANISDPTQIVAVLRCHSADSDPVQLVAAAQTTDAQRAVDEDLAIGARIGASAVPLFVADGVRAIVGAHPPDVIRQLILGDAQ